MEDHGNFETGKNADILPELLQDRSDKLLIELLHSIQALCTRGVNSSEDMRGSASSARTNGTRTSSNLGVPKWTGTPGHLCSHLAYGPEGLFKYLQSVYDMSFCASKLCICCITPSRVGL